MSETHIETDVVYQHEQLGEILVTGIAKMYDEWHTDGPTSSGGQPNGNKPDSSSENEVLVFYYDDYDGYGGMNPMPLSDPINEFAKSVTRVRAFDYPEVSNLRVADDE